MTIYGKTVRICIALSLMGGSSLALADLQWANSPTGANTWIDQYRGASGGSLPGSNGYGDASGGWPYEVKSMTSTLSPTGKMSIEVNTNFVQNSQYFYGDLFFDTQYVMKNGSVYGENATQSAFNDHNLNDGFTTGNDWKYVVHIDDVNDTGANKATVYRISYEQPADQSLLPWHEQLANGKSITKEDITFLGSSRTQQEVSVGQRTGGFDDPAQGNNWLDTVSDLESWGVLTEIGRADWSVDGDSVNFDFDLFSLFGNDLTELGVSIPVGETPEEFDLAYRWTMSCGNDVIEAVFDYSVSDEPPQNVPEPATLALFGIGALGLVGRRQLKRRGVASKQPA